MKPERLLCLHHVPFEGPGLFRAWAREQGIPLHSCWLHAGDPLPTLQPGDMLLVTGGPMSVHDEADYAWMPAEKALIREALETGIPVFGVCLGAQLIAEVLGARVAPMPQGREIGWFDLRALPGDALAQELDGCTVLHWHGEAFSIPEQARPLWESAHCPHQGFRQGSALALQFHIEMGPQELEDLLSHAANELDGSAAVQSPEQLRQGASEAAALEGKLYCLLDSWLKSI